MSEFNKTTTDTNFSDGFRKQYEENLKKTQQEHIDRINGNGVWIPCMHDQCTDCHGTGLKLYGGMCIHNLSCSCPKCLVTY